jgi:sarcosine oxidase / L-pipecolate oxidase
MASIDKAAAINIVGAGVFGLSTAIHLAQRGYKNVTIFDKSPYDTTKYSYFEGSDAASADMNKIFRCAYGSQVEYQALSLEALHAWEQWNEDIRNGHAGEGFESTDRIFLRNGNLCMTDSSELPDFELATVRNMEDAGYANSQLITNNAEHCKLAEETGFGTAMDPFDCTSRQQHFLGVLDTTGGTILSDKACWLALYKARSSGVKTIFGPRIGEFESFVQSAGSSKVKGIHTKDGRRHLAPLTIMACGGWTPTLLPQLDSVCETTAGSVAIIKLPETLARRYGPDRLPSWTYNMRHGAEGGLYGFPATDEGYMKIGFRGIKYTNPIMQRDGRERSTPVTRYTDTEQIKDHIPAQALRTIKAFICEYLPDFSQHGVDITTTRLCWYNDSWDNHFVVDHVPDLPGVFVATAGSGHAFKYLPILGAKVVDVLEERPNRDAVTRSWRWRYRPATGPVANNLMEGSSGTRSLRNVQLAGGRHLRLSDLSNL